MSILKPSQYDCDNMKVGDLVVVKDRSSLYKLYRDLFLKDKTIIKVRKDWKEPVEYIDYYQEDCMLMFKHELLSMHQYENCVPYIINYKGSLKPLKLGKLKNLKLGLENIQIQFYNNINIVIPISYFKNRNRCYKQ